MSAVTKVLVILLAVICIALSMTVIAFTARTNDWRSLATDYKTKAQLADSAKRAVEAAGVASLAAARDTIQSHLDRIATLEGQVQEFSAESAAQRGEIAQLTVDKRQADALAQRLTNELGIAQSAREAIDKQRQQIETRSIDLERRNIDLNQRVNELTTQVAVMNQQNRQQAQQVHILREENGKLLSQVGLAASGVSASYEGRGPSSNIVPQSAPNAPRIAGQVEFVDGNLVTLSVGSADRVGKGAIFVLSRGAQYVGDVEITDVEPNLASGRLIRSAPGVSPKKGDSAEDEYHFANPH